MSPQTSAPLPPEVRSLFWKLGERVLSLEGDRDFVLGRVLSAGNWEAMRWVRAQVGEPVLREYLSRTLGRLLSPRQLRLWQVILNLPEEAVTQWIESAARRVWDRRAG